MDEEEQVLSAPDQSLLQKQLLILSLTRPVFSGVFGGCRNVTMDCF